MAVLSIPTPINKLLVVSDCAGQTDKLLRAQTMIPNYDLTVFLGGAYYKFQDAQESERNIAIIQECLQTNKAAYCLSPDDMLLTEGLLVEMTQNMLQFYVKQPNVVEAKFINGNKIVMTYGGITSKTDLSKIHSVIEMTFTDTLGGTSWHNSYDGRFGYVVSNNPLTKEPPKFYNFSAQIGNEKSSQVYAQEADQYGMKRTILL